MVSGGPWPPKLARSASEGGYSPRCHMRSTVALIVTIAIRAMAIAEKATRYVLSML